jgi:hypothetical protein
MGTACLPELVAREVWALPSFRIVNSPIDDPFQDRNGDAASSTAQVLRLRHPWPPSILAASPFLSPRFYPEPVKDHRHGHDVDDVRRPAAAPLLPVMALRPIYHQVETRVKAHIFVAALALLVQRLLGRRLKEAGVDLSPARAMQALSTVRLVTFRLEGQPERRGMTGGCPDARLVLKALKLVDQRPPTPPEGEETMM